MNKTKAIVLGLLTILPMCYVVFFFSMIINGFTSVFFDSEFTNMANLFRIIFPLHILTMLLVVVLLFIYIRDVFRNNNITNDHKTLWAVVIFFGNVISMIVYWYLNIWKPLQKTET